MKDVNELIRLAVENTKRVVPGYFEMTLHNRLSGGVGSVYEQFESEEELEKAILNADWEETTHPAVNPEYCRVFKAKLPGRFGLVKIDSLPDDVELTADDSKSTGTIAMTVKGIRGVEVQDTYLIIGKELDKNDNIEYYVVFTFHPGEPVKPSLVETASVSHGAKVSKAYAKELGFDLAKIV